MIDKRIVNFVNNVKLFAKEKEIKIGDIEDSLGVSKGYLSRVASGGGTLSLLGAIEIADYLHMKLEELVFTNYERRIRELRILELEEERARLKGERDEENGIGTDYVHEFDNSSES